MLSGNAVKTLRCPFDALHDPLRLTTLSGNGALVSFYDVEARVHIYSATGCTFTEPLYPILYDDDDINSAPLIISPVNQTD
ncbi:unnamed protein product [Boreogadus saida]